MLLAAYAAVLGCLHRLFHNSSHPTPHDDRTIHPLIMQINTHNSKHDRVRLELKKPDDKTSS